jgi:class 3 adenylate cyclase/tetratricopeptide (TPR) repeat protein
VLRCPSCGEENPERFRLCGFCGAALHGAEAVRRPEVRKVVTILFCDVTGSTGLGERLDPESMRRLMSRWFAAAREVLEAHGATVEKFIGDAVMAVFGIPQTHEDDALRAVRAATDLREALDELNPHLQADFGTGIQVRTGVDTGEVVTGASRGADTLVTGDAVNTAARLQQAAMPGEILISRATQALVRDAVEVEPIDPLDLKGKSLPVPAYRLIAVTAGADAHTRHLDSPIVGRDRELRQLREAYDHARTDRSPQLFTILGAAGVGKSRLLREVLDTIDAAADRSLILRGRCLPYGEGITYWPLREVIHAAAGVTDGDAPDVVGRKVAALLQDEREGELITRRVLAAISLGEETAPADEIAWAVRRLLEHLSRDRPVIAVFDDIHWAEPTLLDLIEHIADWTRDRPLLLACLARPELLELRPAWGGGKLGATTVLLEPLAASATAELLTNLLGADDLAADARRRITDAAEGNPLFIEEMVGMLVDDGALRREDGRLVPTRDLSTIAVPASIRALMAARLDHLPEEERTIAERASVVGRIFERAAVIELAPEALRPVVSVRLLGLVRKELLRPHEAGFSGDDTFRFRHLLIRDAAYERLPKEDRADLHERFAAWLERVAGGRLQEYEEIVGYHLEQAYRYRQQLGSVDDRARALATRAGTMLSESGARAFAGADFRAASGLFERAASLFPAGSREQLRARGSLGAATREAGAWPEAGAILREVMRAAEANGDEPTLWRARLDDIEVRTHTDPTMDALVAAAVVDAAARFFERAGDDDGLAHAWYVAGYLLWSRSRWEEARRAFTKVVQPGDEGRGGQMHELALSGIANALIWGPMPVGQALVELASLETRTQTRQGHAQMAAKRAHLLAMLERFDEALAELARAVAIADDIGVRTRVGGFGMTAASIGRSMGDLPAAAAGYGTVLGLLRVAGETSVNSTAVGALAWIVGVQGRYDEAVELSRESERLGQVQDAMTQVLWRIGRSVGQAGLGEVADAEQLAREAIEIAQLTDQLMAQGDAHLTLAMALRTAGRSDEAVAAARVAIDRYAAKGNIALVNRTREAFAELLG